MEHGWLMIIGLVSLVSPTASLLSRFSQYSSLVRWDLSMSLTTKFIDFQISIVKLDNIQNSHRWNDPKHLILLQVDGRKHETSLSPKGRIINENFVVPANKSSLITIQLRCIHQKFRENHVIGETEDLHVLSAARNQDIVMRWRKPGGKPHLDRGSITIRVSVDLTFHPSSAVIEGGLQLQATGQLAHLKLMINKLQSVENGPPQWASLLISLGNLLQMTGSLTELNPKAKGAFVAVAFAFEMVMKQAERHERVNHLVAVMANLYTFLEDANSLKKIMSLEQSVMRLLKQTAECAYFISEYTKVGSFAQRAVTSMVSDMDSTIDAYEVLFGELKIEFIMGSTLQTALLTVRILNKVDKIGNQLALKDLPYIQNASWNPDNTCLRGTCTSIIDDIDHWVVSGVPVGQDRAHHIYLLLGPPQCGKSAISHTISQRYENDRLGSAIFFSRDVEDRSRPQKVFSTIARDLGGFDDTIAEAISGPPERRPALLTATIRRQFHALILDPIRNRNLSFVGPILIVLDGLDECEDRSTLLQIIAEEFVHLPANFRILITSRPEPDIVASLQGVGHCYVREMEMWFGSGISPAQVRTYIGERLSTLESERPNIFNGQHTRENIEDQLATRAMGISIWATTACDFLSTISDKTASVFFDAISSQLIPKSNETTMDHLYHSILYTISRPTPTDADWRGLGRKAIFGILALANPSLAHFTASGQLNLQDTSNDLHPIDILTRIGCVHHQLDEDGTQHSLIFDPLFEYYIKDKRRCTLINRYNLAMDSLDVMNELLARNMLGVEDNSIFNSEIPEKDKRIRERVSQVLQYAVQYWVMHLVDIEPSDAVIEKLHEFLFNHLLHWIELSSFLGLSDTVLPSLKSLDGWLKGHKCTNSDITTMVYDAICFSRNFSAVISEIAGHTYISALTFTPQRTLLYQNYCDTDDVMRPKIIQGGEEVWSYHKTLNFKGVAQAFYSIAYSHDGSFFASAARDCTVRIGDIRTGQTIKEIMMADYVYSLSISPGDTRIAGGSHDKSVYIWDIYSGQLVFGPLHGHRHAVSSVSYSPNGSRIVSGSTSGEIYIWDTESGERVGGPLIGHSNQEITRVAFPPNGFQFASCSSEGTIRLWDLYRQKTIGEPMQHKQQAYDICWSPDGSLIASCGHCAVILWDSSTRAIRRKLTNGTESIIALAFSPDGVLLIGGCGGECAPVHLWDVKTGDSISQLSGHSWSIHSIAVSPDGLNFITGGQDATVRLWDISPYHSPHPLTLQKSRPSVVSSPMPDSVLDIDTKKGIENGWIFTSDGKRYLWVPAQYCWPGTLLMYLGSLLIRYGGDTSGTRSNILLIGR